MEKTNKFLSLENVKKLIIIKTIIFICLPLLAFHIINKMDISEGKIRINQNFTITEFNKENKVMKLNSSDYYFLVRLKGDTLIDFPIGKKIRSKMILNKDYLIEQISLTNEGKFFSYELLSKGVKKN